MDQHNLVKVKWDNQPAIDAMGSEWVTAFDYKDLPDLITVPSNITDAAIKSYIEGRYGYQVARWSHWSAIAEARTLAENLYSADPM